MPLLANCHRHNHGRSVALSSSSSPSSYRDWHCRHHRLPPPLLWSIWLLCHRVLSPLLSYVPSPSSPISSRRGCRQHLFARRCCCQHHRRRRASNSPPLNAVEGINPSRHATISPQGIVVLGLAVGNEAFPCSPRRDPEIPRDRTRRLTLSRHNPASAAAPCRPSLLLSPPPQLPPPPPYFKLIVV